MKITANGKDFEIETNCSLSVFLETIGRQPGMVVIERNKAALTPSEVEETILEEGDKLEIVRIVAGG